MLRRFVLLTTLMLLSGCATLFSPSDQPVRFESQPSGAKVYIDGKQVGITPTTAMVDRQTLGYKSVRISKDGFKSYQFDLSKTLNTTAILNSTFLLCWATDLSTGNLTEYSPGEYYIELVPVGGKLEDKSRRRFELVNRHAIARDRARGGGPYLNVLANEY